MGACMCGVASPAIESCAYKPAVFHLSSIHFQIHGYDDCSGRTCVLFKSYLLEASIQQFMSPPAQLVLSRPSGTELTISSSAILWPRSGGGFRPWHPLQLIFRCWSCWWRTQKTIPRNTISFCLVGMFHGSIPHRNTQLHYYPLSSSSSCMYILISTLLRLACFCLISRSQHSSMKFWALWPTFLLSWLNWIALGSFEQVPPITHIRACSKSRISHIKHGVQLGIQ